MKQAPEEKPALARRTFFVEVALFKKLKRFAVENEITMYRVVNDAIRDYIKNYVPKSYNND